MPAQDNFDEFWKETAKVPCDDCTVCCRGEDVIIRPHDGDVLEKYKTHTKIRNGVLVSILDHKEGRDECIYLIDDKCSIYDDRPIVCRTYDCRVDFLSQTKAQHRQGFNPNWEEGKKRLHTLDSRRRRASIAIRKMREIMLKRLRS